MRTGERLRLARRRLRLTQRDLAGDDFHRSLISQIETGLIEPSLQTLTVLADRVGLPASFFIQSEGEETRTEDAVEKARLLLSSGDPDAAHRLLIETLPMVSSFRLKARLLLHIGDVLLHAERPGEALGFLQTAQCYLRTDEDPDGLVEALLQTGRAQSHLKRHDAAIESYSEGLWLLERFINHGDRQQRQISLARQVRLTLNIGKNWVRLRRFDTALEWLHNAVSLATEAQLFEDVGLAHQSIAVIHKQCRRYTQAEYHNKIALRCLDQPEHTLNRAICLSNMGGVMVDSGQPKEAIAFYMDALSEAKGDPRLLVMIYAGLATANFHLKEHEKALHWGEKAFPIFLDNPPNFNNISHVDELPEIFLLMARIYMDQRRQAEACQVLEHGLQWCKRRGIDSTYEASLEAISALPN